MLLNANINQRKYRNYTKQMLNRKYVGSLRSYKHVAWQGLLNITNTQNHLYKVR